MFQAIHKQSGKLLTAFQLEKDLTWQGKEKDVFIAPYDSIENWIELKKKRISEVSVTYIKRHKRQVSGLDEPVWVLPHFRIITVGAKESLVSESEAHQLAKDTVLASAWDDRIEFVNFNNDKLSSFGDVKDVKLEGNVGKKRADVLVEFSKVHPVLGRGVAFEIQISPQNDSETVERSYARAAQGYSVVWIWSDELENFTNRVEVIPFAEALKRYKDDVQKEADAYISDLANKAKEASSAFALELSEVTMIANQEKESIRAAIDSGLSDYKMSVESLTNSAVLERAKTQIKETHIEEALQDVIHHLSDGFIKDKVEESIRTQMDSKISKEISRQMDEKITVPDVVYREYTMEMKRRIDEMNFEEFTKEKLVPCFECGVCGKLVPVGMVYWKKMPGSVLKTPLCHKDFTESDKSNVPNEETKILKGQANL